MFKKLLLVGAVAALNSVFATLAAETPKIQPDLTELRASVLVLEAQGEGTVGMACVNEVITTRANGKSAMAVLTAHNKKGFHAFSCLNGRSYQESIDLAKRKTTPQIWRTAYDIASGKLHRNSCFTKGATHYDNVKRFGLPAWAKGAQVTVEIGNHRFFKLG